MIEKVAASVLLEEHTHSIAHFITDAQFENHPELLKKYGKAGKEKCLQDAFYHLSYLQEALKHTTSEIFSYYIEWASIMLSSRNVPVYDLINNLEYLKSACKKTLPAYASDEITKYIDDGLKKLESQIQNNTFFSNADHLHAEASEYLALLLKGEKKKAQVFIHKLMEGESISSIYKNIFTITQYEVGLLWQTNKITVAHEHYCTAATQTIIASLFPFVFNASDKKGKLLACTVSGDLHELGIRMLSDEFEINGWDSYYLGANMPDAHIISAAIEQQSDVLAISVTMPFHLTKVATLITKIRETSSLSKMKIIVGGYPFNLVSSLAFKVGADGSAKTSKEAIALANQFISKN